MDMQEKIEAKTIRGSLKCQPPKDWIAVDDALAIFAEERAALIATLKSAEAMSVNRFDLWQASEAREAALARALALAKSMILSGEKMSAQAEAVFDAALATATATPNGKQAMSRLTPCEFCGKTNCEQCAP